MKYQIIIFLLVLSGTQHLSAQLYESSRLAEAKFNHKSMAILPVYVAEKDNSGQAKKEGRQGVVKEDESEGYNLQRSFYNYFITRKPKKVNWTVEIQTYEETNKKLSEANITYSDITQTPKDELAKILGVDALYFCEVKKLRTISDGGAVALDFFIGYGGYTGNIDIESSIYEGESGELMWKYDRQLPTSYWGQSDFLVDNLMKRTIEKFPYKEKIK
jgi:hypothetical protein